MDVQANYCYVKAYRYTTVTSVMLIECWSVPCVMLLSFCYLKASYNKLHVLGAFLCAFGLVMMILCDNSQAASPSSSTSTFSFPASPLSVYDNINTNLLGFSMPALTDSVASPDATIGHIETNLVGNGTSAQSTMYADTHARTVAAPDSVIDPDPADQIIGDLLVLVGCSTYALYNIAQEKLVKDQNLTEMLGMIGLFSTILSVIEMYFLGEFEELTGGSIPFHDTTLLLYMFGYTVSLVLLYIGIPMLLVFSSAVMMTLSFVMADTWAIIIPVAVFGKSFSWAIWLSFFLIVLGLCVYGYAGPTDAPQAPYSVVSISPSSSLIPQSPPPPPSSSLSSSSSSSSETGSYNAWNKRDQGHGQGYGAINDASVPPAQLQRRHVHMHPHHHTAGNMHTQEIALQYLPGDDGVEHK